jgi:MFS family permease
VSRQNVDTRHSPAPPWRRRLPAVAVTWGRLRVAITALFALDGFVFGSWAARVPDVASQVGATPSLLGLALLCLSVGALAAMQLTGALCQRLGAGMVSATAAVLLSGVAVLPGLATSVPSLAAALLAFGAVTGAVNVAANSLGVRAEAWRGRPLLPSLHAGFSFGGLGGALAGGLASAAAIEPAPHLLAVTAAALLVTTAIAPALAAADALPAPGESSAGPARSSGRARFDRYLRVPQAARRARRVAGRRPAGPRGLLVALGVLAGCTAYGEGALMDWGALHLRESVHASPAVAAGGYAGFSLAMAVGRLAGNRLVELLGSTRLLAGGALLAAAGMLVAAFSPVIAVVLAGFVLVGLGLANVFPLAIARAGALGGAAGVALASTVGYTGLLGGPAVMGVMSEQVGLPVALTSISVLAVLAAGLAVAVGETPLAPAFRGRLAAAVSAASLAARGSVADLAILTQSLGTPEQSPGASAGSARRPRPAYPGLELIAV